MRYQVLNFDVYRRAGGNGTYDRGVLTSPLSKWGEFHDEVRRCQSYRDYVWRGQRRSEKEWPLKSTFDRLNKAGDREPLLKEHLDEFRRAIRGRRGANPPDLKDDDLWALGQHQGLATPLLDWTLSPFVAAYFAFFKREGDPTKQNDGNRAVYGLNRDVTRFYRPRRANAKDVFIVFPEVAAHENARFLAQSGILTRALKGQDIKERVQRCYSAPNESRIILIEILIPNKDRKECLRGLEEMNINHASLFPDIFGSAMYCNLRLEIDG